jgi:1,4-dihydroxy-2-naphthoate octaprenyltransferase
MALTETVADLKPFVEVARPPFLALPVSLVALGATAGTVGGSVDPIRVGAALIGLVALNAAVNALNEASDYESGIDLETDPTPFSGGTETLPAGELSPAAARRFGLAAAAVGGVIGLYFLVVVGPILAPLLIVGAVCVLTYTTTLTRLGVGELAAGIGLGALPIWGVALVADGRLETAAVWMSVPAFLLTFDLLLLNEFPDQEPDRRGGRRNLIHRLGRRRAASIYALAAGLVPVTIVAGVAVGVVPPLALIGVVPSLLLYTPLEWALGSPTESVPTAALRNNVGWILATNGLLAVGVWAGQFV